MIRVTPFHFSPLQTTFLISFAFYVRCTLGGVPDYHREPSVRNRSRCLLVRSKLGGQASVQGTRWWRLQQPRKHSISFLFPLSCTCAKDLNAYYQFHSFHSPAPVWENLACRSGEGCYAFPVRRLHCARRSPWGGPASDICKSPYIIAMPPISPRKDVCCRTRSSAAGNTGPSLTSVCLNDSEKLVVCSRMLGWSFDFLPAQVLVQSLMLVSYWLFRQVVARRGFPVKTTKLVACGPFRTVRAAVHQVCLCVPHLYNAPPAVAFIASSTCIAQQLEAREARGCPI